MNVLVTGGAGYLGSVLIPKLLSRGHSVRVLDMGYFGLGQMQSFHPPVMVVREDLCKMATDALLCRELLGGCDAVIHLAAISNDPSAELNPELTERVNFAATVALAEAARDRGIRFLFSSSCSVYGEAEGEIDEDGYVNPLTTYAVTKVRAERSLVAMANRRWRPVILRNGTLFGYSPRMRFDLVVNIFSLYSALYNEIKVFGGGRHWRPFLHVLDCARAFVFFAERTKLAHLCYNVAHENLRVADVVDVFRGLNPRLRVTDLETVEADQRNYRVSTRRLRKEGFKARLSVATGAEAIIDAIVSGMIRDPESVFYRNAKWLRELTHIGEKDHREVMGLMETMALAGRPSGTQGPAWT
jgi:nucleoside-diphosphate-sugar epimerase